MELLYRKAGKRMELFIEVKRGAITLKDAGVELGISYRHTKRLYKKYKMEGLWGLIPKKRKGEPWNKTKKEVRKKVIDWKRNYKDLNLSHISDLLKGEGIQISRETVRRILLKEGLHSKHRKYKRRPKKRFEAEEAGKLVQMDTSPHEWIPGMGKKICFIAAIDDHSRKPLAGRFAKHDTTWENMCVLREIVETYGVFEVLYTDNDSKFKYIRRNDSLYFTYKKEPDEVKPQVRQALNELGIRVLNHHVNAPYQKGKIERFFGYLQDRLINEFRIYGIKTIDEANEYLRKWLRKHSSKHVHATTGMIPDERFKNSCFRPLPPNVNLDDIFCLRATRVVKKDNTFSYNGKVFQLIGTISRPNFAGTRVSLRIIPRKKIRVSYDGKLLQEFPYDGE